MSDDQFVKLQPAHLQVNKAMTIAGICERYDNDASAHIPSQWQRFNLYFGSIPQQVTQDAYGVVFDGDDDGKYNYICGVEVNSVSDLPDDFDHVEIPARKYLVFVHTDHISSINRTWSTIWGKALPESDYELAEAPTFERYSDKFDPTSGTGDVELWIPVNDKS